MKLKEKWENKDDYKIRSSLNVYLSYINLIYTSVYLRQLKSLYIFNLKKKTTKESCIDNTRHYYVDKFNELY